MKRVPGSESTMTVEDAPSTLLPAIYRIVVKGRLDPGWRERLGGMEIEVQDSPGDTRTHLEGPIRDRAELSGILNTLYDLHLTLIRVEVVEASPNS